MLKELFILMMVNQWNMKDIIIILLLKLIIIMALLKEKLPMEIKLMLISILK
jgi:hypothetical protein